MIYCKTYRALFLKGGISMGKMIRRQLGYNEEKRYEDNEIEIAFPISQNQLNGARLYTSKDEYAKTLNKNISYLEVGVAWGYSAKIFINTANAKSADLVDFYNSAHGIAVQEDRPLDDSSASHEEYIKNKFSYHPDVNLIKGDAKDIVPTLNKRYDLILLDMDTDRLLIRNLLRHCSRLTNVGGVVGLTSYVNYDSILYDHPVGVFQSVNEFLHFNSNWSVDAMVLNDLGFHDIYIKKNSEQNIRA
jgi:hypothetical protein